MLAPPIEGLAKLKTEMAVAIFGILTMENFNIFFIF